MSSTSVSVPKYRHHKGSGQAFVQIKGRRHYLGKWDSPAEQRAIRRLRCRVGRLPRRLATSLPLTTPASQITVVELAAAYLDFAEGYYRKRRHSRPVTGHISRRQSAS